MVNKKPFANILYGFRNNINRIFNLILNTTYISSNFQKINENIEYRHSENSGGVPSLDNEPYYTLSLNNISKGTFNNPDISNERYGHSVSLSGDGQMLVVSSPNNNSTENGYVYIYEYDNDNNIWDPNYYELSDIGNFGITLEIDRQNSNYIVIGNTDTNKVTIYEKINTDWVIYRDITINDGTIQSVSLSGNTLVVGTDTNTIIYKDENGSMNEIQNYNISAHSVSISGYENKIVIGDHNRNTINIFEYTDTWEMTQTFTGETNEQIGWSVKISYDGFQILYGAPFANNNKGLVRNIIYINETWEQNNENITGLNDGDKFGWSIDLSINGYDIIVGAPQTSATTLFETNSNTTDFGYVKLYQYTPTDSSTKWLEIENYTENTINTGYAVSMDSYNYNFVYSTNNQVIRNYIVVLNYQPYDILTFPHTDSETGEEAIYYILNSSNNIPILRPISIGTGYVGDSLNPRNFTTLSGITYNFDIYFNQVGYKGEAPITNVIPTNNVTIVNGGENYNIGDYIQVVSDGEGSGGTYLVTNVNENGSVLNIQRYFQGQNYNSNSTFSFQTNNNGSGVELVFNDFTTISVTISTTTNEMINLSNNNKYNIDDLNATENRDEYWSFLYNNMDSVIENWILSYIFIVESCYQSIPNSFQYDLENIMSTTISPSSLSKVLLTSANLDTQKSIIEKFVILNKYLSSCNNNILYIYERMSWGQNSPIYMFIINNFKKLINKIDEMNTLFNKMVTITSINYKNILEGEYDTLFTDLQNVRKEIIVTIIETGEQFKTLKNELIF